MFNDGGGEMGGGGGGSEMSVGVVPKETLKFGGLKIIYSLIYFSCQTCSVNLLPVCTCCP